MINKEDTNTKKRVRYPFSCEERLRKVGKAITFHVEKVVSGEEWVVVLFEIL